MAHKLTLSALVDCAETAMMEGKLATDDPEKLKQVVGRLGAADESEFQPTREDLGYELHTHPTLVKK